MLLENYRIKEAIQVLKSLDLDVSEKYWVYSLLGKAFYEINEYLDVIFDRNNISRNGIFKRPGMSLIADSRLLHPLRIEYMDIYGVVLWHLKKDVELSHLGSELQSLHPSAPETW